MLRWLLSLVIEKGEDLLLEIREGGPRAARGSPC